MSLQSAITDLKNAINDRIDSLINAHKDTTSNSTTKGHSRAGGVPQTIGKNLSAGTDNGYYARADHVHTVDYSNVLNTPNALDVVDNVETNDSTKPLSAKQGMWLNDNKASISHEHSQYLTTHQDISGKENTSNKTALWNSTPNHTRYPTERLVKESLDGKANSTHTHDYSKVSVSPTKTSGIEIGKITVDGTETTLYQQDNNTTYSTATQSANGLMSSSDKTKLDGIATSANNYSHPSYTARTGKPTANQTPAFGGTATVSQITSDASGHVTGATDRTITIPNTEATTSAAGLMSSADKTKLNGIATGANKTTVDSSMSSSSTNPVQNKIVNSAIDAKTITVEKQSTAETGFIATYVVKQNGTQVGEKINIPKDFLVKSASLKTCTTANSPLNGLAVNDPYLDFVVNVKEGASATDEHIYINVKDLVDTYTAGTGLTLTNNAFSVNFSSATNSTAENVAATPKAVKAAYDLANGKPSLGTTSTTAAKGDHNHDGTYLKSYTPPTASTSQAGIVQLSDSTSTTSSTIAATSTAVKAAYDKGNHSHPYISTTAGSVGTSNLANDAVTIDKVKFTDDIGGTNLLIGTQQFGTGTNGALTGEYYNDTAIRRYNNTSGTTYVDCSWSNMPPTGTFKQGDKYTLSFWAKGTGTIICYSYGYSGYLTSKPIKSNGSNSSSYGDGSVTFTLSSTWKRFYVTWELNPNVADSSLSVSKTLLIRTSKGADSYIAGVMFEKGEIAHDWTTSPFENNANKIVAASGNTKDLNNYTTSGFYYNDNNTACAYISNLPESGKAFFLLVESWGASNYTKQTITHYNSNKTYTRIRNAGTWGSWKEISADTNTTYTAGTNLSLSGTTFNHATSGVGAKSSGLYKTTIDAQGHITAATAVAKTDITGLGIPAQDTTYTAASATPLPSTKDGTVGTSAKYAREDHVHPFIDFSCGESNTAGYITLLQIKINSTYQDTPIKFEIFQRNRIESITGHIRFTNTNNTDPALNAITHTGKDTVLYLYKSATSTWQLILKKGENVDNVRTKVYNVNGGIAVTKIGTQLTTLPTGTTNNPIYTSTNITFTSDEKTKLAGIATGANNYSHPTNYTTYSSDLYKITVNNNGHVSAASKVTIDSSPNSSNTNNLVTSKGVADALAGKAASSHTSVTANTSTLGHVKVDSSMSSNSTNPVQNKVINTALSGKASIGHVHDNTDIKGLGINSNVVTDANGDLTTEDKLIIGTGQFEAAAGNHNHSGTYVDGAGTKNTTNGSAIAEIKANTTVKGTIYHPKVNSSALTGVPTANTTIGSAGTFTVSQPSVSTDGHVTALTTRTYTLPTGSTSQKGILQIGTGSGNAAAGNHTHTMSNVTDWLNKVYPIGSIYMNVDGTKDPNSLIGGTWVQISQGRMLLGAGTYTEELEDGTTQTKTYTGGASDGSKNAVLVSHYHNPSDSNYQFISGSDGSIGRTSKRSYTSQDSGGIAYLYDKGTSITDLCCTNSRGVDGTDKNMPPYLVVYMWKRTA